MNYTWNEIKRRHPLLYEKLRFNGWHSIDGLWFNTKTGKTH